MKELDRNKLQDEMADYLVNKGNLICQWGTSMGKSFIAVKALFIAYEKYRNPKFLLVVAETAHKDNWKKEFIKCLGEEKGLEVLQCTTIICYASLKNYKYTDWTYLIMDEVHHACSSTRLDILETIKVKRVLGLSATLKKEMIENLESVFGKFKINKVSLQTAIEAEILPKPKVIVKTLYLDSHTKNQIIDFDWRTKKENKGVIDAEWGKRWTYLKNRQKYKGYCIRFKVTELVKYEYYNEQFEYYKRTYFRNPGNERLKNMWLQWGNKRKRFLGELKSDKALSLIGKLRYSQSRFICFCSSIEQADYLGKPFAIHSNNSESQKLIKAFNDKEINELFAINMLQEGISLTDIEKGIIIQLDGIERGFAQKFGRIMRAKEPIQYIFYYKGTRDEEYLKTALEGIDDKYITYEDNN